jgi:hypothetical protein
MATEFIVLACLLGIPATTFFLLRGKKLLLRIVCSLLIFVLLAVAIPNFVPARSTSAQSACVNNLRVIQIAKARWAMIAHKGPSDFPTESDLFSNTHDAAFSEGTGYPATAFIRMPACPAGGT